jgi:hypothetical protein
MINRAQADNRGTTTAETDFDADARRYGARYRARLTQMRADDFESPSHHEPEL